MRRLALVLACLRALEFEEATVSLDGSGDSGDAVFDHGVTRSGETVYELPCLTVDIVADTGGTMRDLICEAAAEVPDGNWWDNEGGYGTVTFRPFEEHPYCAVSCDVTYRGDDPGDEESDFEDEEDLDLKAPETEGVGNKRVAIICTEEGARS